MSTYVIGDVQGCFDELLQLVDKISFDPARDTLWFVGDLVNRGRGSLETLRFVKSLGASAITVLGNHDLHLLALFCGLRPRGKDPTLEPILDATDSHSLINWLLQRPLLHREGNYIMVHAGLHRDWSIDTAEALAKEIESELAQVSIQTELLPHPETTSKSVTEPSTSNGRIDVNALHTTMQSLYGQTEGTWLENAETTNRLRYAVNCFTRMRFCDQDGTPDFKQAGPPGSQPDSLVPWFELQNEFQRRQTLLIGHWAAMGLQTIDNLHALDSGCVWGNSLTALCLTNQTHYSVACKNY